MGADTTAMTDMTREEIGARLETVETRLEGKIDRLADRVDHLSSRVDQIAQNIGELKSDNRTTRWTVIATVVASMIAVAGLTLTEQANLLAAFEVGIALRAAAPK